MNYLRGFFLGCRYVPAVVLCVAAALGSPGDVDTGFNGAAVRSNGSNLPSLNIQKYVKQPDGKIIVCGGFSVIGNHARPGIARLNADGTVDPAFVPPKLLKFTFGSSNIEANTTVFSVGVQLDGKMMISGDFVSVDGLFQPRLIRLNSDGSPDTVFNASLHQSLTQITGEFHAIKQLANGQTLLGGNFDFLAPTTVRRIGGLVRLNADGTFDDTFAQVLNQGSGMSDVYDLHVYPDGGILVGGRGTGLFNSVGLAKLHSDGFIDFSFTGASTPGTVFDFEVLPSGQIIIVGSFSSVNSFPQGRIARINAGGSLDTSFNTNESGANETITTINKTAGGKFLIGGNFIFYNSTVVPKLIQVNADGSQDSGFEYDSYSDGRITSAIVLSDNRILIGGIDGFWSKISILESDGSLSVQVNNLIGMAALARAIAVQPDGKILVAGRFASANGEERQNIVRFNAEGSLDTTFDAGFLFNQSFFIVNKLLIQPDGKILVGSDGAGQFQTQPLMRLDSDGALDLGFDANLQVQSQITDMHLQADGKILAVGSIFPSGSPTRRIARFNTNGALDNSFQNPQISAVVLSLSVQSDGKLIIGGAFGSVDGNNRGKIARLTADGAFDASFNPPGGANGSVWETAIQSDGKIVLGGEFTGLNGDTSRIRIGRLNSDGSLDSSFSQQVNSTVYSLLIEADGKILVGGQMTDVGGTAKSGLVRLNANGSLDNTYKTGSGMDGPVWSLLKQSDGKLLASGEFTKYKGDSHISIVRILGGQAAAGGTLFDFDGDGRADITVFRPATNVWYQLLGINSTFSSEVFGGAGDIVTPADYDGDGKADPGIFRPTTGEWWYKSSIGGNQVSSQWGQAGDIPRPSDFDGDGKADLVLYRPTNFVWYRFGSTGEVSVIQFGAKDDKPVIGDFDGDGKSDLAVYRPSTGDWWWKSSIDGIQRATRWGISTDYPVPADYDGDGKTDFAVFRPATGVWYVLNSQDGSFSIAPFGTNGDKPVTADYDGDGKADFAVYRPGTGIWYRSQSTEGFNALSFGIDTDVPIPFAFVD